MILGFKIEGGFFHIYFRKESFSLECYCTSYTKKVGLHFALLLPLFCQKDLYIWKGNVGPMFNTHRENAGQL